MAPSNSVLYEEDFLPSVLLRNQNIERISILDSDASNQSLLFPQDVAIFFLDKTFYVKGFNSIALYFLQNYFTKLQKFPNDIQGKELDVILSAGPKFLQSALQNALKGKSWFSKPIQHKKGRKISWLQWEVFPYAEKAKDIIGVIVSIRDVTHHQQLLLTHKKLQDANELLEGFNLIMAHDLMQPLRQISNFVDILEENKSELPVDVLSILRKSIDHIQKLSEAVTLYCKQGNLAARSEKISIKNLVNEICADSLATENFLFDYNINDDVFVHANRTCMVQLFQNLLVNAIKHSTCEKTMITLSGTRKDKNFYMFFLHNNGASSGHLMKKNIFHPFHSFAIEGAGLGLMICRKIVEAYKGKIFFCAQKNKGVTVCFTLPISNSTEQRKISEKKFPVNCEYILREV